MSVSANQLNYLDYLEQSALNATFDSRTHPSSPLYRSRFGIDLPDDNVAWLRRVTKCDALFLGHHAYNDRTNQFLSNVIEVFSIQPLLRRRVTRHIYARLTAKAARTGWWTSIRKIEPKVPSNADLGSITIHLEMSRSKTKLANRGIKRDYRLRKLVRVSLILSRLLEEIKGKKIAMRIIRIIKFCTLIDQHVSHRWLIENLFIFFMYQVKSVYYLQSSFAIYSYLMVSNRYLGY